MVSMARPFLADPEFVNKAAAGRAQDINTCIGCNQACLDHTFAGKITSCLVNPRACHETILVPQPLPAAAQKERIAVVGAGPAGLAFATEAAQRGLAVTLLDAGHEIGGQFNIAKQIPGKEEFYETLRYFGERLQQTGVTVKLGQHVAADDLVQAGFKHVVLATGISPRLPQIEGMDHPKVLGYLDVLRDKKPVGQTVAVIGAGGIGFDVSEYLLHEGESASLNPAQFFAEWGVDTTGAKRGGVQPGQVPAAPRQIYLLQRKSSKVGAGLGKTTGWIHRTGLKNRGVQMLAGVTYRKIDDAGLHITVEGQDRLLAVDNVIVCAGQDPNRELQAALQAQGVTVHLIGGADKAAELDAKRAIQQGTELALRLDPCDQSKTVAANADAQSANGQNDAKNNTADAALELSTLRVTLEQHIATVTLNRADKANAMNAAMWQEIRQAFEWVDRTPEVRVAVLQAEGKLFCSGIDLQMMMSMPAQIADDCEGRQREKLRRVILDLQDTLTSLERCRKPVLAAIHGPCIGGGVDLVVCADMRYASSEASFCIKEIDLGMVADVGTLQRLPKLVGQGITRELAYTGRTLGAAEAQQIGLVNRVFDSRAALYAGVQEIARQIAAKSPLSIRGSKEMLNYARDHSVADGLNHVATWNAAMLQSDDLMAAMVAGMSKQTPEFKN